MNILGYLQDMYNNPDKYRKFWVAALGFGLTVASIYFPEAEWLPPLVSALTAAGIWTVPNAKEKK